MTEDVTAAGRTVISKAAVILMTYLNGDVHTLTEIATATGLPLRPRTVSSASWPPGRSSNGPTTATTASGCRCA